MRKNKKFASFLTPAQLKAIRFKKIASYRLIDDVRVHTERLLTIGFAKDHLRELQTPLFEYQVSDTYKTWTIVKKLEDFQNLKADLSLQYPQTVLPVPIQNIDSLDDQELRPILDFFEHFLNSIGESGATSQDSFLQFIGNAVGEQLKQLKIFYQGKVSKRAGGRHNEGNLKKLLNIFTSWEERMLSITPQGLYLCEEENVTIQDSLMFSSTFSILYGQAATDQVYGVVINSSQRILSINAQNIFNLHFLVRFLSQALNVSEALQAHRFGSFAPLRFNCDAKSYIDGDGYFNDLYEALMSAKKEVFITGWMISPYFSLKRPDPKASFRIDNVLMKIAEVGIKVHIVLFNGPKIALNIDSQFTETYLNKLSSNIKVILHPNYILIPFLWSHHQKMVVIDQKIAFMGGLDLGYGRYDNQRHLLTNPDDKSIWVGADLCNYRQTDIVDPKEYTQCSIDPKKSPRMPWHDIGVRLLGASVQDLCRHFIQYWNYVNLQSDMDNRELLMYVGLGDQELETAEKVEKRKMEESEEAMDNRSGVRLTTTQDTEEQSVFKILNFWKRKSAKKLSRSSTIRLPFPLQPQQGQSPKTVKSMTYIMKPEQQNEDSQMESSKEKQFYMKEMIHKTKFQGFLEKLNPKNIIKNRIGNAFEEVVLESRQTSILKKKSQHHQILRSAALWGTGLEEGKPEHSIWNAYLHLIRNAKEFIYIENQFFMSEKNGVAQAIAERIIKAHINKQKFRVVIVLPALPGFDGHPADENAAVFRIQMHYILKTVREMYCHLEEHITSPSLLDEYIFVFSLRTHCKIEDKPVTEIIYVHSKLMIIDDRAVLVGSANINDRSLKGTRDTELAIVIEDEEQATVQIEGEQPRTVSAFAYELRKGLYMQHFNLTSIESQDYFSATTWSKMVETSKKNHDIYRILFGCYPDNAMSTFADLEQIHQQATTENYDLFKTVIKSNAIPYQRSFLCDQDLTLKAGQAQYFLPDINFT